MPISLIKIFENNEIENLSSTYKSACYKAFTNWLSEYTRGSKLDKNLAALRKLLSILEDKVVPDDLSTFFYHTLTFPPEKLSTKEISFLLFLFLFDSLFLYLPCDTDFEIQCMFNELFYLPIIGKSIELDISIINIAKKNDSLLTSTEEKVWGTYQVSKRSSYNKLKLSIADIDKNDFLYKKILKSSAKYDKISNNDLNSFEDKLSKAINLIIEINNDFKKRLCEIEFVIPMAYVSREITKSFTLSGLPHVIFLSDANSYLKIMENLIHECLHDELNIFMKFYSIICETGKLYYSAWREDARPIRGLIHALYVFTGIHQFYFDFFKIFPNSKDKKYIRFRYNAIHYQLKISFLQLKNCDSELTNLGKKLLNSLYLIYQNSTNKHILGKYPEDLIKHTKTWRTRNPKNNIELPDNLSSILE